MVQDIPPCDNGVVTHRMLLSRKSIHTKGKASCKHVTQRFQTIRSMDEDKVETIRANPVQVVENQGAGRLEKTTKTIIVNKKIPHEDNSTYRVGATVVHHANSRRKHATTTHGSLRHGLVPSKSGQLLDEIDLAAYQGLYHRTDSTPRQESARHWR
jgi:hypothetical protein